MKNDAVSPITDLDFKEIYDVLSGYHPVHKTPDQFTLEKLHRKYKKIKQVQRDPVKAHKAWERVIALEIGKVFGKDPAGIYPHHCNYPEDKFTVTDNILISDVMNSFNNSFDWILNQVAPDNYGLDVLRKLKASDQILYEFKLFFPSYNYPIKISELSNLWNEQFANQIKNVQNFLNSFADTNKYLPKTALKKIKTIPYINRTKLILFYWLEHKNKIHSNNFVTPRAIENLLYQNDLRLRDELDIFICWLWYRAQPLIKMKREVAGRIIEYTPRRSGTPKRIEILSILEYCESIRYSGRFDTIYKSWRDFLEYSLRIKRSIKTKLLKDNNDLNQGHAIELLYKHIYPKIFVQKLYTPPVPWDDVKY